jgi:site-specific recombinase XerD
MKLDNYHAQQEMQNIIKLREMLKSFPPFVAGYFRTLSDQTAARTRVGYAYDLRIFFTFLQDEVFHAPICDISIAHMATIDSDHIEEFMEYLSYYVSAENPDAPVKNAPIGKSRKLAAVRGLFKYMYKKKLVQANPAELVD